MPQSWSAAQIRKWGANNRPVGEAGVPGLFNDQKMVQWRETILQNVFEQTEATAIAGLKAKVLAEEARVLGARRAQTGFEPLVQRIVDGRVDNSLATVRANSEIILDWNYLPEIANRVYVALVERSPRLSGAYIAGLLKFVDGERSDFDAISFDTREVRIVASVDYARRLEIGHDAVGAPFVKQVAPHIVEETAIISQSKFSKFARVSYNYMDLVPAYQLKDPAGFRTRRGRLDTEVHYPCIIIEPL